MQIKRIWDCFAIKKKLDNFESKREKWTDLKIKRYLDCFEN